MLQLSPDAYRIVEPMLRHVSFNDLFARAVVERHCRGEVFVDRAETPRVAYVRHRYGMSLLFGEPTAAHLDDDVLEAVLRTPRAGSEWLQVFPEAWGEQLAARVRGSEASGVALHTRVNFELRAARRAPNPSRTIVRVDRELFARMPGTVVPRFFWDDADDFLRRGLGYAVLVDGNPASMAFSSFVVGASLELGIETAEAYRGRGLAFDACAALIEATLARGLVPVWACRLENAASHRLAERLGFAPSRYLPYFELPPSNQTSQEAVLRLFEDDVPETVGSAEHAEGR